ncbi:MAG TPA: DUF6089 family protein [Chitinophagaceae bacterium]|jgi:hypothetical protein|nr:DUF6089 family protein [Chitinophagaceae bacterium]
MKKITLFTAVFLLGCISARCQRLSIDVMPGLMNYAGDLQPSSLTFNQACIGAEIGLQYQLTDKIYLRADYLAGQVKADDKRGIKDFAIRRNLNFKSIILEGSVSVEYDFYRLRIDKNWTPYVFAGVGYYFFNPYTYDTAGNKYYLQPYGTEGQGLAQYPERKFYKLYQFNIPAGLGLKYAVSDRVSIGFEVGFRKLFTDYLDDVSTTYPNQNALSNARGPVAVELSFRQGEINPNAVYTDGALRGSSAHKDDYYTGLFRLTYTLGANKDGFSAGYKKSVSCPKPVL